MFRTVAHNTKRKTQNATRFKPNTVSNLASACPAFITALFLDIYNPHFENKKQTGNKKFS